MARVVKIKSELKKNKNRALFKSVLFVVLFVISSSVGAGVFFTNMNNITDLFVALSVIICIFLAFVFLICFLIFRKEYQVLLSGVKGENNTRNILKKLPKDFTIITNPVIQNRGVTLELDFVVIGKNGVFIVESKNYRGIVRGKTSQQKWKQIKHGKGGNVYEKEVGNPVKQANRQRQRMVEMFRDFQITAKVFPVLYFADNYSKLEIEDDAQLNVAIINNENHLLDYIVNSSGRKTVDSNELAKIIRFFKR